MEILNNNVRILGAEHLLTQRDDLDALEATVAPNLLGPIRQTASLPPLLQWQTRSAIVNVSSVRAFVSLATQCQFR